jgi:folate-binding protein YgfZ
MALSDVVIEVRGLDARTWLNGQITNQILTAEDGAAVYSLVLDGRGKIVSDAWVLLGDPLQLVCPAAARETLLEHFEKYIVMEDVELLAGRSRVISVQGPRSTDVTRGAGLPSFPVNRLGIGGREVLTPPDREAAVLEALLAAARGIGGGAVTLEDWETARIEQGVPAWGTDFGRSHYPQEAGLASTAVSFLKGCYLGQEVVCTLENRGQLTRRLVTLHGEGAARVAAGDELTSESKAVGQVTSSAVDANGVSRAIGYVKRALAVPGTPVEAPGGTLRVDRVP